MRNIIHKVLSAILIAGAIGLITSTVYASVIFVGDTANVGFKSAQKVMPAVDFTCQNGQDWYNGKCVAKCDRNTYSQATALDETKGTIASCTDAWGTYYTYTSCHNGWDLIEGDCIETDCSNFSYTSAPESIAGTVTSCKSGLKTFYKYLSCKEGWDFANGKCTVHTCSSTTYPYTTNPSSDAGTIVSCKTGAATQYGYSECRTGWDKSNGYCNIHVCDNNAFPFTSQPSNSIGTVSSCKTGNDVKYGYSACSDDYELKNGQCEIKCTYTATSKPTGCATATDSCTKNGTTYYAATCARCESNYELKDASCTLCDWKGYKQASSSISGCSSIGSKTCGGLTKYGCTTCSSGYSKNSTTGACTACTWNNYTLTDCPSGCNCASNTCGGSTKYTISSAQSGYYVSGNSCPMNDCSRCAPVASLGCLNPYYNVKTCQSGSSTCSYCSTCKSGLSWKAGVGCSLSYCTGSDCRKGNVLTYNGTPIGIVIDSGKAVALEDTASGLWCGSVAYSACTVVIGASSDDGESNTNTIMSVFGDNNSVASRARNYAPSVCGSGSFCGAGNWYAPSESEMRLITYYSDQLSIIGASLSKYYWTSTENSYYSASSYYMYASGKFENNNKGTRSYPIRPILKF